MGTAPPATVVPAAALVSSEAEAAAHSRNNNNNATMGTAPPTATVVPAAAALVSSEAEAARYNNLPAAEIIDSLPMETLFRARHRQYGGFWQAEFILKGMASARTCFKPNPSATDIILASLPKSGTTWLKALAFATLNRATLSPSDSQHPLRHRNPHDCVSWLEFVLMGQGQNQQDDADGDGDGDGDGDATFPASSPRPLLLHTHLPYSMLPHGITAEGSGCRIVYVCRDPKDVLVSAWNYQNKRAAASSSSGGNVGGQDRESAAAGLSLTTSFEEAFELFCEGRFPSGPHWLNALEYWHESQRRPNDVLFLRYEDLLGDPVGNLKKLAAFMGCAFSVEEEEAGVPEQIVELCSLESLKNMGVNKGGTTLMGVQNVVFFRKGQVGDWKNYMTMDMAARLDKIVEEATRGSGLIFGDAHLSSYGLV